MTSQLDRAAASVPYVTFDTPSHTPTGPISPAPVPDSIGGSSSILSNLPLASEAIAAALQLTPSDWQMEAATLTREEVHRRLLAADLAGLTDAIWEGLRSLKLNQRERSMTPTLATPRPDPPTPTMARQPLVGRTGSVEPSRVQQFVPVVPMMHGRVPRSEESWQYYEEESGFCGCLRAVRAASVLVQQRVCPRSAPCLLPSWPPLPPPRPIAQSGTRLLVRAQFRLVVYNLAGMASLEIQRKA